MPYLQLEDLVEALRVQQYEPGNRHINGIIYNKLNDIPGIRVLHFESRGILTLGAGLCRRLPEEV